MNTPPKDPEKVPRKLIGVGALLSILGFLVAASLLSAWTTSRPGLLSIYVGLSLAFFAVLVISMRSFVGEILGVRSADSELSLIQAFKAMLLASLVFILLGLLHEMRA